MILVHRSRFGVSTYHRAELARRGHPLVDQQEGPVLPVRVRFADWLGGADTPADAFVDPGADGTVVSWRWLALAFDAHGSVSDLRTSGQRLEQDVFLQIGPRWLKVPRTRIGPRVMSQPGEMPGYEDILLGRDFLDAHGILTVIDGEARQLSLLLPDDDENRRRRDQVLAALDPAGQ